MTCRPTLGASPHPSKSCPRMIRDYGRGRLRATPATGVRSRCPRFPLMGCCRTLRHPSPANAQFSGTSMSPRHAQLSLTLTQRDAHVTTRHMSLTDTAPARRIRHRASRNSRQHPAPRDISVTSPHSPLTGAVPERHVRRQPAHVSRQSRTDAGHGLGSLQKEKRKTLRRWNSEGFVELMVIETTTSSMRTKRSTN